MPAKERWCIDAFYIFFFISIQIYGVAFHFAYIFFFYRFLFSLKPRRVYMPTTGSEPQYLTPEVLADMRGIRGVFHQRIHFLHEFACVSLTRVHRSSERSVVNQGL